MDIFDIVIYDTDNPNHQKIGAVWVPIKNLADRIEVDAPRLGRFLRTRAAEKWRKNGGVTVRLTADWNDRIKTLADRSNAKKIVLKHYPVF